MTQISLLTNLNSFTLKNLCAEAITKFYSLEFGKVSDSVHSEILWLLGSKLLVQF